MTESLKNSSEKKIHIPIITPLIGLTLVFVWSIYHLITSDLDVKVKS